MEIIIKKDVKLHFIYMHIVEILVVHFWQGNNTMVMHWLMEPVDDIHMLYMLVAHGSNGFAFSMVIMLWFRLMLITLLVMILYGIVRLYSDQAIYLSYIGDMNMGGALGKVTTRMVELLCGT